MRFKFRQLAAEEGPAELSLTPLIDVVLLLLIFFMLTSTFVLQEAIVLFLPDAATAEEVEPNLVAVQITQDDQIFVDGEAVPLDRLYERLIERFDPQDPPLLYLMADRNVYYSRPMTVLDIARQAGYRKLGLAAQQGSPLDQMNLGWESPEEESAPQN